MYVWVGCSFSMVAKMSILNYLIRLSNSCKCMGVNGEALLEARHYICPMHAAIPPFPGSPLWNINMCMHAGRAWYLFSREHNVIKIGPEFLEQKTFCVLFNQLCVECLVHVYDIQLLIRVVHVNYLLPSLFFLF